MKHSITVSENGTYIIISVSGDITAPEMLTAVAEAHRLGQEKGISRYLADVTEARNIDSTERNYRFAYKDIPSHPELDINARISILVSPEDHSHDFAETVMRNAGLNVALFRNRDWAIARLL